MDSIRCGGCGTHLGDGPDPEPRKPCPACGSTRRAYHEHVVESVRAFDATGFKFSRTVNGKKEWVAQGTSGYERSRATGRLVRKDSLFDKEANRRFERVEDAETGEELHHCDHKLTDHVGHGSAKFKAK